MTAALRISRSSTPSSDSSPALPRGTSTIADAMADPRGRSDSRFCILQPCRVDPEYRTRPDIDRDPAQVPAKIADAFRACRTGRAPWPLYIFGAVGTGKTRFALCAQDLYGGRLVDFSTIVDEFKAVRCGTFLDPMKWTDCLMSESAWLDRIAGLRLLTIDEVGTRDASDHARETLTRILNARECRPTVLISNMSPVEIAKIFDERVSSRFCAGAVVRVDGKDRRLK